MPNVFCNEEEMGLRTLAREARRYRVTFFKSPDGVAIRINITPQKHVQLTSNVICVVHVMNAEGAILCAHM